MNARNYVTAVCCVTFLYLSAHLAGAPPAKSTPAKTPAGKQNTATDAEVTSLEREAMNCRSAADAVNLYNEFLAVRKLTAKQTEKVLDRKNVWQDRIERKLVRLGTEWVTSDHAKETGAKADGFIREAFSKIKEGDYKKAKELLEKAVRQDPSGVRADYYIGMLNSPNFWNYAPAAEKSFERAQKRDPDNSGVANNLALSRLKMGHWGESLDLWAAALRSAPEAPDVVQNLGRFVKEGSARRIPANAGQIKRAKKLYDKAIADKKGLAFSETTGWLYSALQLSPDERARSQVLNAPDDDAKEDGAAEATPAPPRTLAGSGTGFVIHPGYVLTNRHVAEGGTTYGVFQPGEDKKELAATVLTMDSDHDLALFQCDVLAAPQVTLNIQPPRRSSEVLVLGFPFGEALGSSIKAVRGTVFGFDDDAKRKIMMYEATTNPGNSGGPVCDNTGRVVAVHFAGLNLGAIERGAGKMGMGIPIEVAMPFLNKSLPELTAADAGGKLEWPEIDEKISKSVVLIKLYVPNSPIVRKPPTSKSLNVFEDCTCTACKGRSKVPCPIAGCFKGSVSEFEASYTVNGTGVGAQVLQWQSARNRTCPGCRGAGVVDCQHCADGLDPALKRTGK